MAEEPDPSPSSPSDHPRQSRVDGSSQWRTRGPWIASSALLLISAVVAFRYTQHRDARPAAPQVKTVRRVPVDVVAARRGDIGVYVTGLGTVTPLNTITVKTRIDGQLMTVLYREGQRVRNGDPLVEIDPRPYEAQLALAEAQLARDQATLQNARTDLQRYESLIKRNAVAEQVLMTQRSTVAQNEGVVRGDEATIQTAKLNITYCHITAPLTGRVGLRLVDPGNLVSAAAGTALVIVTQTQPITVIFTIPEQQLDPVLARVRAGERLRVDAFDSDMQAVLATGELKTIDNLIDQTTGTVKLRATMPNKDEVLFPNQFVNSRLLVQEKHGVTLVPNAAVQRNGSTTFAWIVRPDDTVAMRTVTVGTTNATDYEIISGVAPGDLLVTAGVDKLREGTAVQVELGDNEDVRAPPAGTTPPPVPTTGRTAPRRPRARPRQ